MNAPLDMLGERVSRLSRSVLRLIEENRALRARLHAEMQTRADMERCLVESRARVESALARLPPPSTGQF